MKVTQYNFMDYKQYSDLQRCIGVLEGIGTVLDDKTNGAYYDTLEVLTGIIEGLKPKEAHE